MEITNELKQDLSTLESACGIFSKNMNPYSQAL